MVVTAYNENGSEIERAVINISNVNLKPCRKSWYDDELTEIEKGTQRFYVKQSIQQLVEQWQSQ